MGEYKDDINVRPHNFNTSILTIDSTHNAEGLEMIEVEDTSDNVVVKTVASGMAIFEESNDQSGTIKFQTLEAGPTTDIMWALVATRNAFKLNFSDSNAPELKVTGKYCRVQKKPVLKRGQEGDVVEWVCIATYLKSKGGSYRLEIEE